MKNLVRYGFDRVFRPERINDHQFPQAPTMALYKEIINPYRYNRAMTRFPDRIVTMNELVQSGDRYVFFPMHAEPEISLLTYGRPFLNQIEVARWFALSLPMGWKLVLKDHPGNPYYRSGGYFKKLFEIPNTLMVHPGESSYDLAGGAEAIMMISGFVGFEALCRGKPVIAMGRTFFEILPDTMYRRIGDPEALPAVLREMLETFELDDAALVRFVAAVVGC